MNSQHSVKYENTLLCILFLAFGFVFFDRLAISFLFPFMQEEMNLTNTDLGLLSSVLALAWALSGAVVGAYSDRKGIRKPILLVAIILFSLCSAISGLVTTFITLLVFRLIMGLAEGPILPLSQYLMAEASSPKRRGFNMGLLQGSAAGLLGAVVAPVVLVGLAEYYGWRHAFVLSLIPGLIIAFLVWRFVKPDDAVTSERKHIQKEKVSFIELLKYRNILVCALISCAYLSWFVVLVSFTPTFLVKQRLLEPSSMATVMSCLGIAWVFWGAVVPAISDRIGRKVTIILFSLVAACCPIVLMYAQGTLLLSSLVILTYTGLGCFTLFMATIPAETVPKAQLATALGLIMGFGELVGGFAAPMLAGLAADHYGLSVIMWISFIAALAAAFFAIFLKETAPIIVNKTAALSGNNLGGI
jgi:MFS family permease